MREPIQIEIPLNSSYPSVNIHLVKGEHGVTLIDAGKDVDDNWAIFQKGLSEEGVQISDISEVIITHEHNDHIGFIPKILDHSEAIIRASRNLKNIFEDYSIFIDSIKNARNKHLYSWGLPYEMRTNFEKIFAKVIESTLEFDTSRVEYFSDYDYLNIQGDVWQALHVPGHCNNQFCFVHTESKACFGGDMMLSMVPFVVPDEQSTTKGNKRSALNQLLESYELLLSFGIEKVYPGHGSPFENASNVIHKHVDRITKRRNQCLSYISSEPQNIYQVSQKMYPPSRSMSFPLAGLYMTMAHIDSLEEDGLVNVHTENKIKMITLK